MVGWKSGENTLSIPYAAVELGIVLASFLQQGVQQVRNPSETPTQLSFRRYSSIPRIDSAKKLLPPSLLRPTSTRALS